MKLNSWGECQPIFPRDYLRTNTIFEVACGNGLNTVYLDKHPTYKFLNGPSGLGLTQGFFPNLAPSLLLWKLNKLGKISIGVLLPTS